MEKAKAKAKGTIGRRSRLGRRGSQLGTLGSSRGAKSGGGERRRIYGSDFVDSDEPLATEASRGLPLGLGSQAVAEDEPVASGKRSSSSHTSAAAPSGARRSGTRASRKVAPTERSPRKSGTGSNGVTPWASSGTASGRRSGTRAPRFKNLVPRIEGRLPVLSTQQPGLLVVLSDLSSSMGHPFAGQRGVRKVDALADVVNGVLLQFVDRMNQGGTIKNRLDVLLTGYQSNAFSMFDGPLRGRDIVSIAELADNPAGEIEEDDGEGNMIGRPIWVEPRAAHRTAMRSAFQHARGSIARWKRRPAGPHLVLGIHVTDGESTDGSPGDQLEALAADVAQSGGELLMTNIHLSSSGSPDGGVVFPDEEDAARLDAHGRMLFEMSSPVPAALAEQLGTKPGARMMAYNATVEQFARVFEAGSSVAAQ
ncbi:MAG TPA: hypothetical protein VIG06_18750 [Kofleriaceae bacterium]